MRRRIASLPVLFILLATLSSGCRSTIPPDPIEVLAARVERAIVRGSTTETEILQWFGQPDRWSRTVGGASEWFYLEAVGAWRDLEPEVAAGWASGETPPVSAGGAATDPDAPSAFDRDGAGEEAWQDPSEDEVALDGLEMGEGSGPGRGTVVLHYLTVDFDREGRVKRYRYWEITEGSQGS
jgi:hypothetical protein